MLLINGKAFILRMPNLLLHVPNRWVHKSVGCSFRGMLEVYPIESWCGAQTCHRSAPRSCSVAAPTLPAAISGPETRSKGDGNHHELLIPFCYYQGSYALDYSLSKEMLLITDSVPNVFANCLSQRIAVLGNTFLFVVSFYYVQ